MKQKSLPAVFMRGGTSKALMLNIADLPAERDDWTPLFSAAMGTPDPYGRQLDGMGGGVSSLSKVCIIGPSSHPDADVDYTFAQVAIKEEKVDYRGNCGNMSSAVGPYAVEQALVQVKDGDACVRILNTNTNKIIHAHFTVEDGQPRYDGDLSIPGVGGTGSPIRLDFVEPGGASTGSLLPSGELSEWLDVPGVGRIEVSLVDAANAAVFVRAADVGLTGLELPDWLEAHSEVLERLDAIRVQASVRMGIAPDVEAARQIRIVPFVCIVSPAQDNPTLSGDVVPAKDIDLVARVISNGQPHRALPLTISLCTAVAARLTGSLPSQCLSDSVAPQGPLRLGMPSGVLTVGAEVEKKDGRWFAKAGSFYRTARRLFDGRLWVPGKALKD